MFRVFLQQVDPQGRLLEPSKAGRGEWGERRIDQRKISKFLALVLRHEPDTAALKLDNQGWADVATLITGVNAAGYRLTSEDLQKIVDTSLGNRREPRFSFSADKRRIRANWGHSFPLSC
jgi:putative RNA 2'-phosphotransferase